MKEWTAHPRLRSRIERIFRANDVISVTSEGERKRLVATKRKRRREREKLTLRLKSTRKKSTWKPRGNDNTGKYPLPEEPWRRTKCAHAVMEKVISVPSSGLPTSLRQGVPHLSLIIDNPWIVKEANSFYFFFKSTYRLLSSVRA